MREKSVYGYTIQRKGSRTSIIVLSRIRLLYLLILNKWYWKWVINILYDFYNLQVRLANYKNMIMIILIQLHNIKTYCYKIFELERSNNTISASDKCDRTFCNRNSFHFHLCTSIPFLTITKASSEIVHSNKNSNLAI